MNKSRAESSQVLEIEQSEERIRKLLHLLLALWIFGGVILPIAVSIRTGNNDFLFFFLILYYLF